MLSKIRFIQIMGWACALEAVLGGGLYLFRNVTQHIAIPPGEFTAHAVFLALGIISITVAEVLREFAKALGSANHDAAER